jgi:RNA polymerase sigma-70 factor, ECF subfamily
VADGDRHRAFIALLDAHGAAAMATLRRLCRHARHDADDAFQETAARVWRNLHEVPRLANPRAWVMTIAYRSFVDVRARQRPHEPLPDAMDGHVDGPADLAQRTETLDRVQSAVATLDEPVRQVVVLHYMSGLTIAETASAMKLSAGTVKSRLNAALNRLRSVLE